MEELETLNMLLRLIGSSPVNSLSSDHPDAANARATMKRVSRRIQRRGWWCNRDYNVTYSPDNRGKITVPATITSLTTYDLNIVLRGRNLYNKALQTAVFNDTITAKSVVYILEWDDMPQVMQEVVAYTAAGEFVRDELEDLSKEQSLKEEAGKSMLDLNKQELDEGQYNIFNKPRVRRALSGIRPSGRQRAFFGSPDR